MEAVYLLCLKEPLGSDNHWASHYLGYAKDLDERLELVKKMLWSIHR